MAGPSEPGHARELLERADAARGAGDDEGARAAYVQAFDSARALSDVDLMARAALGLATGRIFGTHPGRVPAYLHEAYSAADGPLRTRLAAALARAWAYGGDAARATEFAVRAVAEATGAGDDALLADALDAELVVRWGPDDLAERLRITSQLEDVVAHSRDTDARMSAHLWRLTTALECLDIITTQRQLRALELLADDSADPRTRFFAASRQAMYALLIGNPSRAAELLAEVLRAGDAAREPDTMALEHALVASIARQRGDTVTLTAQADEFESFGTREGVLSVAAEATVLWLEAGQPERSRALLDQLAGDGLDAIARDVDWLLTVVSLTESAAALDVSEILTTAVRLLEPYAGRGVVNAGAVGFVGVVDDYLAQACAALGRPDEAAAWAKSAAACYARIGATWWAHRLDRLGVHSTATIRAARAVLRPESDGVWTVGVGGELTPIRAMKGLQYLRLLLQRPGVEITALAMSDAIAGHAGAGVDEGAVGDRLDRQALAAYRQRIADLDEELGEASEWADDERRARLQTERDALLDELRGATGLAGRRRLASSSTAERARVAVRKAVAAAIDRITEQSPGLGRLLHDCIDTGTVCAYRPDPTRPVDWVLD